MERLDWSGIGMVPDECGAYVDRAEAAKRIAELESELAATRHEMAGVKTAAGLFEARLDQLREQGDDRLRRAASSKDSRATLVDVCARQAERIAELEAENAKLRKVTEAVLDFADEMGPCGAVENKELYCKFDDCLYCALIKAVDNA